ncbi:4,5-dihydroxyphthalate decarboxylase [Paraburkholderia silvatlantica]|uniref:4,5-dihydroxyphthalate decarboxylase n=1 Tax=Paraburkholderia silvatlantica TaxID=321895 RepID=A0ABR6FGP7_9BURK|nr:4,5-dihydroxyphthalate decarboxylase [Paraburkholderia silvatlantica]MBB2926596.1 4,5-dihydroxyphthalate decarboxylase [Paraburkholderia silvatlantica]PVY37766.1 4,5-dihydroxyphthalate decarboxylase [Paraburkholderia silvatlantica]PXW42730.1 4,5-dihydroxyphthalate decarboxylase [Paraburkholderia silvatlantica]
MPPRKLDIGFWNYDRAQALRDGEVKIDGVDARFHNGRIVTDIFEAMVKDRAYDVSDLGFSYFLRTMDTDEAPFRLLPVPLLHMFRHSAIYINKTKGIERPEDLNGKRIGELALYGHDAGVMPKGMLSDEFGFRPESCRWIVGGIDFALKPIDWLPKPVPAGVEVIYAKADDDLGEMLAAGEIDALISADAPKCVLERRPNVGRLFEDYETVERDYYRRTGVFPIMHMVTVKKELADDETLMRAVYKGFLDAKEAMAAKLRKGMTFNNMTVMIPWLSHLMQENMDTLGEDWWPYGIAKNRPAIEAFLRYHYEQGLSKKRWAIEEVFVPALLDS